MASNNQINVQLNFTANTAAAKKNIEGLQQTLTQLAVGNSALFKADATTAEIQKVSTAATELQYHLSKSLDANGTLNLKKLNVSLKTAGANINQLSSNLLTAGSGGAQAFVQLSTAISQANVEASKLNLLSNRFFKQLKRTAEIQISNTIYQTLTNGLKNSYEYAQELNKSLNDIRIVSGQSAQQMADFAKHANKAAQALSSNTTAYTNAALIYYQQGLSDEQVIDRTDVTIKMANVTGDAAKTVSDQMTAIWNNFYDGSQSLEYYADVLTALGAATASSTDEIAEGVEKFAAIGKVTGLSYEYATAALATLVDRTRQSADTVGTSLKTIFSRLQGLQLGETLEDGLDLNKYSKALATVGVQVLDVNGQMRDMDTILGDLASRWTTLNQGQKMALAQTVAGVRQYNNLISLMDNWDFMEQNLQVAYNSEGTINEQADIYAESWEAAKNRTKVALEDIYQDLIDDKMFIKVQDFITSVLQGVNKLVENIGGFKGVLLAVASIMATKIQPMATKLGQNLMMAFASPQKIYAQNNKVFSDQIAQMKRDGNWNNLTNAQQTQLTGDRKVANVRANYMSSESQLNAQEKGQAQVQISIIEMTVARLAELAGAYDQIIAKRKEYLASMITNMGETVNGASMPYDVSTIMGQAKTEAYDASGYKGKIKKELNPIISSFESSLTGAESVDEFNTKLAQLKADLEGVTGTSKQAQSYVENLIKSLSKQFLTTGLDNYKQKIIDVSQNLDLAEDKQQAVNDALSKLGSASTVDEVSEQVKNLVNALGESDVSGENFSKILQTIGINSGNIDDISGLSDTARAKLKSLVGETENLDENLANLEFTHAPTILESFGQLVSVGLNGTMAFQQFKGAIESFQDGDTVSGIMSLTMGFTNLASAMSLGIEGVKKMGVAFTTFSTAMNGVKIAKTAGDATILTKKASEAAKALGGSGTGLLPIILKFAGSLGGVAAILAAVAAAIGLVVLAIKYYDQKIQTAKETTEDINTAWKDSKKAVEETKNVLNELKTSFDELDNAYTVFDKLKVGTLDFQQAVIDTNQKVIDLLASVGKLDWNNIEIDDNGLYHIKKSVKEDIISQAQERSNTLQNYNNLMSAVKAVDDFNVQVRESKKLSYANSEYVRNITGSEDNRDQLVKDLAIAVSQDPTFLSQNNEAGIVNWLKSKDYIDTSNAQSLTGVAKTILTKGVQDEITSLSTDYISSLKQTSVYMTSFVQTWQKDTIDAMGELGDVFTSLIGKQLPNDIVELYNNTYRAKWDGKSAKDVREKFAEIMGFDENKIEGSKDSATYYRTGETEGSGQVYNDTGARFLLAVLDALKDSGVDIEATKSLTKQIGANDQDRVIQSILTNGNGENSLFKKQGTDFGWIRELDEAEQKALLAATDLYDNIEDLIAGAERQATANNISYDNLLNNFKPELAEKLTENVSFGTAEALSNLFSNFDLSGVPGVKDNFTNMLIQLTENLDDNQLDSFLTSFLQIDFSDWDAMNNVIALCQQFGISLDGIDINQFAMQFRAFGNALPISQFEELNSKVATLVDLLSKLKIGAKFSADEFAKVAENLKNAEEYFVKIGDDYVQIKNIDANDLIPIDYGLMDEYQAAYEKNKSSGDKAKFQIDDESSPSGKRYVSVNELGGWREFANDEARTGTELASKLNYLKNVGFLDDETIAGMEWDGDTIDNLIANQNLEQLRAFFDKYQTFLDNGAAGNYDSSVAKQGLMASAGSVEKASNLEGFYDEKGVATDEAVNAMKVMATETERGRDALSEYQEEIKGVEKGTDKWNAATKKLEKTLRTIEADEVAKQTRQLVKSLEDLTDEAEKQEVYAKLAEQLESIFGGDITAEWVKNNLDVIKAWQEGGDAAMKAAAQIELAREGMGDASAWADETKVIDYATRVLGMNGDEAKEFANQITSMSEEARAGLAALDGVNIDINGQADFTQIAQACADGKMSVEDLVAQIKAMGLSNIQFSLNGSVLEKVPDMSNLDEFRAWWGRNMMGKSASITATGTIPSDAPTPSMSSIGGKGGGGGGSKKTKEKKPVDNKDRYHTVDQQLEDLSNQLDELGDAEDRAFGAEKIKTMAREMAKLNEQVAKYNDKLVEAKNYLTQDRAKAEDFASKIGMSIQYGSNGEILNWDELKKGYLDWYNAGVDKYNAGGIDDDAFSKQYDDVYSDAMDAFDQLEETNNLVQELQQNILDTQRKYEDMYLAIQKEKLEINITIDENGMKLLEYFFDKLNDDLYDSVERMSILEDQIGNLIDQASAYEQNINGLLGTAGQWDGLNFNSYGLTLEDLPELLSKSNKELYEIFGGAGSNVQEIIDQLQNDYEKLLDTNKQITETRQKLVEEIGNSFSSWNEEIDKAENKLEQNAQLMEHYRNVIDIVGRKTLGITSKFIKDYNIKQLDNDLAQLSASYAQLNEQREAVSALEQAIMRETSEETKALMQKELDSMRDTLNEQVEDTAQKWEDCMRGIQEAYEDTVSVALDDWQTKMAGLAGSADMLQLSFDMATDIDDNYLDDYDKIYELSKLSADINNSIDDTDNIQSKEDLVALMEKVNELNESDADISQYTVDVLRARYELLKAEDALKEAQNAKSTVRLTQDNEGNWGYVYTADQDAVSQAEQEYADKLHALEEINQNYINDLDQKLADLTKSASEKINQIAQDSTLTLEEKKEKIQEVYEYTNEMERYLMEQTQFALEDAMEIYEVDAQKYSELTGNKMLDDEKWVNSFEEMKIAQITGFTELQDWDQQFSDSWDDTVRNLITTTDEFVEKNAEAFDTVKMDIKNASEEMGDDLNQIADDTNKVRDSIIDMGADAEQTIVSVIDYAKTWSDEWSTAIDAIISKNELLAKSCDTIISKLADAQAANDALNKLEEEKANQDSGNSSSGGSGSSGGSSSSSGGSSGSSGGSSGGGGKGVWVGGVFVEGATTWQINQAVNSNNQGNLAGALGSLKRKDNVTFNDFQRELNKSKKLDTGGYTGAFQYADTGMYTGQWANGSVRANGRLAFLHQKELVLNAHDTENFLQAVDIVRNLNESLDLGALSMSKGLGNITARGLDQNTTQTIDQNVSIKAEFPNVQDRNEIEEAFNNLINKASQYANRKNK